MENNENIVDLGNELMENVHQASEEMYAFDAGSPERTRVTELYLKLYDAYLRENENAVNAGLKRTQIEIDHEDRLKEFEMKLHQHEEELKQNAKSTWRKTLFTWGALGALTIGLAIFESTGHLPPKISHLFKFLPFV